VGDVLSLELDPDEKVHTPLPEVRFELLSPDDYLYACTNDPNGIDPFRLRPVIERVFIRLMVDETAFILHVVRLMAGRLGRPVPSFPENYIEDAETILKHGFVPETDDLAISALMLFGDHLLLGRMQHVINKYPPPFWKDQLAARREPSEPDDRDDLAAARLYELHHLLREFH
jgi:hypothetical protein